MSPRAIIRRAAVTLGLLAVSGAPATGLAQDAKPDTAKPLKITAAIAYLDASGNTDVTSLAMTERLEWKRPHFLWAQHINFMRSSSNPATA
jgi:putative salt-induced outer membrane protein YdiY